MTPFHCLLNLTRVSAIAGANEVQLRFDKFEIDLMVSILLVRIPIPITFVIGFCCQISEEGYLSNNRLLLL